MAGILVSKTATYEFEADDIRLLIAKDLGVSDDRVKVEYVIREVGSDLMDRYRGTNTVTGIKVTVNQAKDEVWDR